MGVRQVVVLLGLAMLAACDAPTVPSESPGYDPRLRGTDLIYHWPLGHTIAVYTHTSGAPAGFDLRDAIRRANDLWGSATRYREFDVRFVSTPAEADVVFHFDTDLVLDLSCADPPTGAAGVTTFCVNSSLTAFTPLPLIDGGASEVRFDVQISTSSDRIADLPEFRRIVAHEFGHVIGIGNESDDNADLMFGGPVVDALSPADAQTIRWLLHQPAQVQP